jgi:lysophospholipase L1-like esterase
VKPRATGYGSRFLALALSPLLFPQSRVYLSHLPKLDEAHGKWKGTVEGPDMLRLLVFGDSTVAGVGVDDQSEGLAHALAMEVSTSLGRGVKWKAIARSGVSSGELRSYFLPRASRGTYDLVFISIGVNDVLHVRRKGQFTRDLRAIIETLSLSSPTATIFVAGIPRLERFDSLPDPLGTILGARGHRLNAGANEVLSAFPSAVHVPPWPIDTPGFFAIDQFHPSAIGYAAWARASVKYWLR